MFEEKIDRKTFLRMGYRAIVRAVSSVVERGMDALNKRDSIRPPGAVDEASFIVLCNLCGECWDACPYDAIVQAGENGMGSGTPVIIPSNTPCYLCDPPVCSRVCPEGALKPVDTREIKIGLAVVEKDSCLAYQGIDLNCDYCYDRCPLKDRAIAFDRGPVIDDGVCTGCGVCEYYCVSNPKAIRISPL